MPIVIKIRDKELDLRKQLERLGLTNKLRLPLPDSGNKRRGKKVTEDDGDFECDVCRANLYVSLVSNSQDDLYHCLPHALQLLAKKKSNLKHYTLMYTYNEVRRFFFIIYKCYVDFNFFFVFHRMNWTS